MYNNYSDDNNFAFDFLDMVSYCPLCESHHKGLSSKILEEIPGARLIHTHCHNCDSFIVSLVLANPVGISSIGLVSDLTCGDVLRFKDQPVITYDDVLEFYKSFQAKQ